MNSPGTIKKAIAGGALLLAGVGVGTAVQVTSSASAATSGGSSRTSTSTNSPDPTKSIRPDEHLLTGTTAAKVTAAVKAKYPTATIQRVETDSDGVYEAHVVTSGGESLIVQLGKDFAVNGTDTGGPGGGPDGPQDGSAPQSGSDT